MHFAEYEESQILKIEYAEEKEDYFTALVLSLTHIERLGYSIIKKHLESKEVEPELIKKILNRIGIMKISGILITMGTFTKTEYKQINAIRIARNAFVHQKDDEPPEGVLISENKYTKLISNAKKILRKIGKSTFRLFPK